jgi:exodeoxyribonuclease V gamma subunit
MRAPQVGGEHGWAEGEGEAIRLALRGRDPFADAATAAEFAELSGMVYGAVTLGLPARIDLGDVEMPDADDAEDAA